MEMFTSRKKYRKKAPNKISPERGALINGKVSETQRQFLRESEGET